MSSTKKKCKGKTKSGKRCKNPAGRNGYCAIHRPGGGLSKTLDTTAKIAAVASAVIKVIEIILGHLYSSSQTYEQGLALIEEYMALSQEGDVNIVKVEKLNGEFQNWLGRVKRAYPIEMQRFMEKINRNKMGKLLIKNKIIAAPKLDGGTKIRMSSKGFKGII